MSSSTSAIFSGSSTFSTDFTQVIKRAQQIASLPITLLTNEKTTLTGQQTALSGLAGNFSSLQAALLSLDSSAASANLGVSYSDSTVATAAATSGAIAGSYQLEVVDAGSHASATSTASGTDIVTDPATSSISKASSFTLTANGQVFSNITPQSNTLSSLADAINNAAGGAVRATIVNMGSTSTPDYQLSIQNVKYGALPITLDDGQGGPNLMGTPTAATAVQYRINGQPAGTPISSDTRNLTIGPNLTATILAAGTTEITVSRSTTNIASQLSAFVKAYNSASTALDGQRGTSGGALAGQSIVGTLSQSLRDLVGYSGGTGAIQSLADLGVTIDENYALTFDPSVLSAAAAQDFSSVTDFLGSASSGGFLKAANDTLNGLTDSISGVIPATLQSIGGEITDTGNQISDNQARVDALTDNLNARMAAADALIAAMQQQATYFTNMFAAMSANQSAMR